MAMEIVNDGVSEENVTDDGVSKDASEEIVTDGVSEDVSEEIVTDGVSEEIVTDGVSEDVSVEEIMTVGGVSEDVSVEEIMTDGVSEMAGNNNTRLGNLDYLDIDRLQDSVDKAKSSYVGTLALSIGMTAAAHPLSYIKVLIQVGHEPLAPTEVTTIFGKKCWRLPNFFQYIGHVKRVDGWFGLYRGLGPKIAQNIINSTITNNVGKKIKDDDDAGPISEKKSVQEFLRQTGNLAIAKTAGTVLSYPFHVISIRMMVQFVGRETNYSSIISSVKEIYNEEGLCGFFTGLVPHLIGELFGLWLIRSLNYLAMNCLVTDANLKTLEVQNYSQTISQYISSIITYPFQLVTNIMAINNTKLAAGRPPLMPIYSSWTACWVDLGKKGLRNRGSTLFRRNIKI